MAGKQLTSNVVVGGKVLIKLGNKVVGFAQSATCTDDYGLQAVAVLGQLQYIDYVPANATHSIDLNMMVLRNESLIRQNFEPTGAGNFGFLSGNGIIGNLSNQGLDYPEPADVIEDKIQGGLRILHGISFDIDILMPKSEGYNKGVPPTPEILVRYKNCYYQSGTTTFSANQITSHNCKFVALDRQGWLTSGFVPGQTGGGGGGGSVSSQFVAQ